MALKTSKNKKVKKPVNVVAKNYPRKTREKTKGYTLVSTFNLKNEYHDMVTDHQKKERDSGRKKPNIAEGINALMGELKERREKSK